GIWLEVRVLSKIVALCRERSGEPSDDVWKAADLKGLSSCVRERQRRSARRRHLSELVSRLKRASCGTNLLIGRVDAVHPTPTGYWVRPLHIEAIWRR
ncbi:MAG: hypothetical protein WAK55_29060, partial [Xanthobacteraceae bacterium]